MPGGDRDAYEEVAPILTAISAKVDGDPCCTYIGADGADHYVKMVHNGIEYGDMQLIAEAYSFMKLACGMSHAEMHDTFAEWNRGELDSYLIEITTDILAKSDPETDGPLVEMIRGPSRPEGYRQVDQRVGAEPGRAGADHRQGGVRALRVRPEAGAGGGRGPAVRPGGGVLR